jgi:oligopeptide transport system substrate-binding protein
MIATEGPKMSGKIQARFFLSLLSLLWLPSSGAETPPASSPSTLRLSQRNEPGDLDPATASLPDEFFIIRALTEGLMIPSANGGKPIPAAAESWEMSRDGLVYTFHLRRGARWSNGDPVTATDFVASFRRVLTPATAAPKADLFFPVKNARPYVAGEIKDFSAVGFRAEDARTLVVTLEKPTPNFLLYVSSGPWLPVNPRVVEQQGRAWTRPENFVGNGPFTLAEWRPHQRIVVRRSKTYRVSDANRVGEIQFVAFDNGDAEERAYRAGQIDVTMSVPVAKLDTYLRERPAELHRTTLGETHYFAFNTRRGPLQDVRVRRALALTIDRRRIVEHVLGGQPQPAERMLPPELRALAGSDESPSWSLAFNPDEARRLLAAAGFGGGKNFPRLEMSSWARPAVLEAVQAMWKQELGIDVAIAMREAKVHQDNLRAGNYDIGLITRIPDVADAANFLADFASGAPGNYSRWADLPFDEALARAAGTPEASQRLALLVEAEQRLVEAAAVAPVYFNAKSWLMSPRVRGWREDAFWTRDYRELSVGTE